MIYVVYAKHRHWMWMHVASIWLSPLCKCMHGCIISWGAQQTWWNEICSPVNSKSNVWQHYGFYKRDRQFDNSDAISKMFRDVQYTGSTTNLISTWCSFIVSLWRRLPAPQQLPPPVQIYLQLLPSRVVSNVMVLHAPLAKSFTWSKMITESDVRKMYCSVNLKQTRKYIMYVLQIRPVCKLHCTVIRV